MASSHVVTVSEASNRAAARLRALSRSLRAAGHEDEAQTAAIRAATLERWSRGEPIGLGNLSFALAGLPPTSGR